MLKKSHEKIIEEALAIEAQSAREAGALGFIARVLAMATIPHSNFEGNEFSRSNGYFTLTIMSPSSVGVPYGVIPRLLLHFLTTEAVKTKSPKIFLGDSLSQFMRELDLQPTGGRWGTITRLKDQMNRLFSSTISCHYDDPENALMGGKGFRIASSHSLWWNPVQPDQSSLFESHITLSTDFFNEIVDRPVPIDIRALRALKQSPMALDIYNWLSYRMSYLDKTTTIPWPSLQLQFGANYSNVRQFKQNFKKHLAKVSVVYPEAKLDENQKGLVLKPSPTHVKKLSY